MVQAALPLLDYEDERGSQAETGDVREGRTTGVVAEAVASFHLHTLARGAAEEARACGQPVASSTAMPPS